MSRDGFLYIVEGSSLELTLVNSGIHLWMLDKLQQQRLELVSTLR